MNNLQMKIAMIGDEDFEDPRSKFFEWLLELGEPLFTYLKDEFGIEKMTVVGIPMLIILIIGIKRKLREDKNLFTIIT